MAHLSVVRCTAALVVVCALVASWQKRQAAAATCQEAQVNSVREIRLDEKTVAKTIALRTVRNLLSTCASSPRACSALHPAWRLTDGKNLRAMPFSASHSPRVEIVFV